LGLQVHVNRQMGQGHTGLPPCALEMSG